MPKLILNDIQNLENSETAKATINTNNTTLETTVERVLFRDGTSPNHMEADLDMNSNRILNLPAPIDPTEPLRKKEGDLLAGIDDILLLNQAVDDAQAAAVTATDQAALAKKWATNPEDVPVTTSPAEFSAMHWAKKAAATAITPDVRKRLTADTIFFTGLGGDDGNDGLTEANRFYSVHHAVKIIQSYVDLNGFCAVIKMFPGFYSTSTYTGFEPPGILNWGAPYGKQPTNATVDPGGALLEMVGAPIGKQVTGGQPIRLVGGFEGEPGYNVVIVTQGTCINALHGGKLIVAGLTLVSQGGTCLYATQGGVIEVGSNVLFGGALTGHMVAENGGTIVTTGNMQLRGSGGDCCFKAKGAGSIVVVTSPMDVQYALPPEAPFPIGSNGPHGFATSFVVSQMGGQVYYAPTPSINHFTGSVAASTVKYVVNLSGGLASGPLNTINTVDGAGWPGGLPGTADAISWRL